MVLRPRRASERPTEYESILLAVSAAIFAWVMRAVLDLYFFSESVGPVHVLLGIPIREIYSRAALATAFLFTGIIIYAAVKRLKRSEASARRLDKCVRSVRAINQLITRVKDRPRLCQRACDELVRGLGYARVHARIGGATMGYAEFGCEGGGPVVPDSAESESIPIQCDGESLGELIVTLGSGQEWDEEERGLLTEVAEDIAFSLRSMDTSEHLLQQRQEVQTILDSVSAYITYRDRCGRYIQVNKALAEMAGVPRDQWVGRTLSEIVPGAEEPGTFADEEVLSTGKPKHSVLEAIDLPRGTRWVQSDRVPYRDSNGCVAGVIALSVDVTDRMEAERALACKEEQLRQSQKMEAIGKLAGGIAHDFNNLLTAISGYTELASSKLEPDHQAVEMLSSVSKASDRAAALTRQLLAFSRKQPLALADQNLNDVISGVTDMLKRLMGEDVELVTELGDDVGCIEADASQIEQVLMNLAVNSRDAMPHGGTFTIATSLAGAEASGPSSDENSTDPHFACMRVSDTGTGMDSKTLAQVFEPFFTTKRPGVGTGLGLSVVDGIVEQHGGWLTVDSTPGLGTAFNIYLPRADQRETDDRELPAEEDVSHDLPESGGERVLLVEDEEGVRTFAGRALRELGYDIVEAASAEEALEALDADKRGFDLVFSDIVLPGKSGTQLAEEIAARDPHSRVLLTSGYLFPDGRGSSVSTADLGFNLLRKPYSVRSLRSAIHRALE
jgi:two-component system cell cycle sensor histidine kinase/response regulator CckA